VVWRQFSDLVALIPKRALKARAKVAAEENP
jgi:hypothetical protein